MAIDNGFVVIVVQGSSTANQIIDKKKCIAYTDDKGNLIN